MLKDERVHRSSLRGLKKCPSCNYYNGNRAKGCVNKNCPLHFLKRTKKLNSIDPVQLISYNETKIYSVRNKEREPQQRNFVQITDTTLSVDKDGSIISRNAICYVDTCKYDSNDVNLSCKHVKSASECVNVAQEVKISKDILYSMRISSELKNNLWSLYSGNDLTIVPPVQRINKTTFVVKCIKNVNFPAGRLHLTVKSDNDGNFDYSCTCKKLKILLSSNNTMVDEKDVCDHVIMLLAGVLSSQHLQDQFPNLLKSLKSFWEKNDFIFDNDFLSNGDLCYYSEGVLNSVIEELDNNESLPKNIFQTNNNELGISETSIDEINQETVNITTDANVLDDEYLELADCQIELMDQFKLTDQIDLCNYGVLVDNSDPMAMSNDINLDDVNTQITESNQIESINNNQSCNTIEHKKRKRNEPLEEKGSMNEKGALVGQPALKFNEWLECVIEQINLSVDANAKDMEIKHNFSIKNDFFENLSLRFGVNGKRRIPNSTVIIKKGKLKGLVQSTWVFLSPATVRRIFRTEESEIQIQRYFKKDNDGLFIQYDYSDNSETYNKKYRKILPDVLCTFIRFDFKNESKNAPFTIEWIPNVFPKSQFGIMKIAFSINFKRSRKL